jgi:DNA-binding NarL/FixJ family response regulator
VELMLSSSVIPTLIQHKQPLEGCEACVTWCGGIMRHVLVVESSELQRLGMITVLREMRGQFKISEADSLGLAIHVMRLHPEIDAVIVDFSVRDEQGEPAFFGLQRAFPRPAYVLASGEEDGLDAGVAEAMGATAHFQHSDSIKKIMESMRFLNSLGLTPNSDPSRILASLSPSQIRILKGLQQGLRNKQIAYEMGVTENTVRTYLSGVYRRLGVNSRTQALILLHDALVAA